MYYKFNFIKKILFILTTLSFIQILSFSQEKESNKFSAIVTKILSQNQSNPSKSDGKNFTELNEQDKIYSGATILTSDKQNVEIILYLGNTPTAIILIKENTDLNISYNNITNTQQLYINYGAIRIVTDSNITTAINSETITSINKGIDLGFVELTNKSASKKSGYMIVFDGELTLISKKDNNDLEIIKSLYICEYEDNKINTPIKFSNEKLQEWKETALYQTKDIPNKFNLALEKLEISEKLEVESEIEEEKPKKSFDENKKIMLSHLLSFETGVISYNGDIGPKFVFRPELTTQNNKFHFGLYLPVNIIPYKIHTNNRFFKINRNNNEWSFGTDIPNNNNMQAKIIDIVDDVLLKINNIRYNSIEDNFFINYGDLFNVSDFNYYSLVGFNSKIFHPMQRKSSFFTNFRTTFIDGFFYAEDVLPKGLYGTDLIFKTPNTLFKSKIKISAFTDCYDFLSKYKDESFFPTQINTVYNLEIFNVSSLGFSFYLSNGILIPFSYNFKTQTSLFQTLAIYNPYALFASLTANTGLSFKAYDLTLASEIILESGMNQVGLFDTLYIAHRENRTPLIKEWMESMISRSINIGDYNFGLRLIINYSFLKHIDIQSSYQVVFPGYFDKLFFRIGLNSQDKWTVNFAFYAEWVISRIGYSIQNFETFQENNILYLGFKISPLPGFDIHINGGIYPDLFNYFSYYKSNFMLDCYILYKPIYLNLKLKNKNFKNNKDEKESVLDIFDPNKISK